MKVTSLIVLILLAVNVTIAQSFRTLQPGATGLFNNRTAGETRIFHLPLDHIEVWSYEAVTTEEKRISIHSTSRTGDVATGMITIKRDHLIITANREGSSLTATYRSNGSNELPARVFIPETTDPIMILQALSYELIQDFYGHREYTLDEPHPLFETDQNSWLQAGFSLNGNFLLKNVGNNQFWKNRVTHEVVCKVFATNQPSIMMQIEATPGNPTTTYKVSYFGFGSLVVFLDPGDQKTRQSLALLLLSKKPSDLTSYMNWSAE
jgi:hypothetical protein